MKEEYYEEYFNLEERHWVFVARRKIAMDILDRYLQNRDNLDILDVGTGTGVMLNALRKYGSVTGVDNSDIAIKFCQERGYYNVVNSCAESLPFENNSFDLVCAMDLLEHLEDHRRALKEFHRVLRPGRFLFITVPAYMFLWGGHDEINMHKRRYTLAEISLLVKESGFSVERISYFNFFFFPVVALVRVGRKVLFGKNIKPKSDFGKPDPLLNGMFEKIFSSERFLLRYIDLPFGVSILCLARRI